MCAITLESTACKENLIKLSNLSREPSSPPSLWGKRTQRSTLIEIEEKILSLQQRERKVRLQKNNVKGRKTHQGRPKKNLEGNQKKIPAKTKRQEKTKDLNKKSKSRSPKRKHKKKERKERYSQLHTKT